LLTVGLIIYLGINMILDPQMEGAGEGFIIAMFLIWIAMLIIVCIGNGIIKGVRLFIGWIKKQERWGLWA